MDDGKIVEDGTHNALIAKGGFMRFLRDNQSSLNGLRLRRPSHGCTHRLPKEHLRRLYPFMHWCLKGSYFAILIGSITVIVAGYANGTAAF